MVVNSSEDLGFKVLRACRYVDVCVRYMLHGVFDSDDADSVHRGFHDVVFSYLLSTRYLCGRSGVRFRGRSNRLNVANGSPPLRRFFGAVLPRR